MTVKRQLRTKQLKRGYTGVNNSENATLEGTKLTFFTLVLTLQYDRNVACQKLN